MFKWFADRAPVARRVREEEQGFTLIELLVVVIIIGILAAIAIPTFLSQRSGAQNASAESDLRAAAAAANSCFADNNGSYTTPAANACDIANLTSDYDLNTSPDVTLGNGTPANTADVWTADASHSNSSTVTYTFTTDNGSVTEVPGANP